MYVLVFPFLVSFLQSILFCYGSTNCKAYGDFWGFFLNNITTGCVFVGYIYVFINKKQVSKLLKVLAVPVFIIHLSIFVLFFLSYTKVTPQEIVINDIMNRNYSVIQAHDVKKIEDRIYVLPPTYSFNLRTRVSAYIVTKQGTSYLLQPEGYPGEDLGVYASKEYKVPYTRIKNILGILLE